MSRIIMDSKIADLLDQLYYKEHNYDGVEQLYKKAKAFNITIKKSDVKNWLEKQQTKQTYARSIHQIESVQSGQEARCQEIHEVDVLLF